MLVAFAFLAFAALAYLRRPNMTSLLAEGRSAGNREHGD